MQTFLYQLSGYIFETNIQLLALTPVTGNPNFSILVKDQVDVKVPSMAFETEIYRNDDLNLVFFNKKNAGFIAIWNKNRLEYTPLAGFSNDQIVMYVLGTCYVLMVACLGSISLHAACVVVNNKAILFCGQSGAGKSSLAAYFYAKGYLVLSDDVSNVRLSENGKVFVYPSIPRIKLTTNTLKMVGKSTDDLNLIPGTKLKYALPMPKLDQDKSYELGAIIFPVFREGEDELKELHNLTKRAELNKHVNRRKLINQMNSLDYKNKVFFTMISSVKMYNFSRSPQEENSLNSLAFIEKNCKTHLVGLHEI